MLDSGLQATLRAFETPPSWGKKQAVNCALKASKIQHFGRRVKPNPGIRKHKDCTEGGGGENNPNKTTPKPQTGRGPHKPHFFLLLLLQAVVCTGVPGSAEGKAAGS